MQISKILIPMIIGYLFIGCGKKSNTLSTLSLKNTDTSPIFKTDIVPFPYLDTISTNLYTKSEMQTKMNHRKNIDTTFVIRDMTDITNEQSKSFWIFIGERVYPLGDIDFSIKNDILASIKSHDTLVIVSTKQSMFSYSFDTMGKTNSNTCLVRSLTKTESQKNQVSMLNQIYHYSKNYVKEYNIAYDFSAPPLVMLMFSEKDTIEYFADIQGGISAFVLCDTVFTVGGLRVNDTISVLLNPIGLNDILGDIHIILLTTLEGYRYNNQSIDNNFFANDIYIEVSNGRIKKIASADIQTNFPGLYLLVGHETALYGKFFNENTKIYSIGDSIQFYDEEDGL